MVRLNLHRISDASQYLFLNRTKHRLRWFPIWFAAIRANRAASLMACSTFGITTRFSCQLFSPRDYRRQWQPPYHVQAKSLEAGMSRILDAELEKRFAPK
jgi:hypothetical protein